MLVTGAAGSIGSQVVTALQHDGAFVLATDIVDCDKQLDVTDDAAVRNYVRATRPDVILHLAGAKHAPDGELDPQETFRVNTLGTANILRYGHRVVLASTCKACDPETVYGASKLIAERMVLNTAGVVVRYYNVRESAGNVFRLWETLPASVPVPYTNCWRYFITLDQAVRLTIDAIGFPTGRYAVDPGKASHMKVEARILYPGRRLKLIEPRRGDRFREPLTANAERWEPFRGYRRIYGPHDPQ